MAFSIDSVRLDGCEFGSPSDRDFRAVFRGAQVPDRVDLRQFCTPVENQGHIGSCTSNATVGAVEYQYHRRDGRAPDLSRLFVYFNARRLRGQINEDCGAQIREAMAALVAFGVCREDLWPYDPALFAMQPPHDAYADARRHELIQYARVDGSSGAIEALAAGLPVVFATYIPRRCYKEASETGVIPPLTEEERQARPRSGHAMLIVGYDTPDRMFIVRNSWGDEWGDRGHCRIPFDVVDACSSTEDFWVVAGLEKESAFQLLRPDRAIVAGSPEECVKKCQLPTPNFQLPNEPSWELGVGSWELSGLSTSSKGLHYEGGNSAADGTRSGSIADTLRDEIRSRLDADLAASARRIESLVSRDLPPRAVYRSSAPAAVSRIGWKNWQGRYFTASFPAEWTATENANGVDITDANRTDVISFGYVTGGFTPGTHEDVRAMVMQAIGITTPRFTREDAPEKAPFGTTRVSEFSGNRGRTAVHGVVKVTVFDGFGNYGYSASLRMAPADRWTEMAETLDAIEQSVVLLPRQEIVTP